LQTDHVIKVGLLWVVSGPSTSYQFNGRYRGRSGQSAGFFEKPNAERLLFPKAVVQASPKSQK